MKKIATLILLSQALGMTTSLASEKRLVAWTVANLGRSYVSNFDVDKYIEDTQLTDAIKAGLFKKAEGDFSKYNSLKSEFIKKKFKRSASELIYAKVMEDDHAFKHRNKRVAFKVSESDYYKRIESAEDRVLGDLLDTGIGIVKSRHKYGEFLISKNYPHKSDETPSDVYWRWYNSQKSRIKTELHLKEVKNYEAYISLKDQRYYFESPMQVHDFYHGKRKEIENSLQGKVLDNQQVYKLMSKKKDWSIVIKNIDNSQISHAKTKDIAKSEELLESAANALDLSSKQRDSIVSTTLKAEVLKKKYVDQQELDKKAKEYLEKYIEDKSNNNNYVLSILFKTASLIESDTNLKATTNNIAQAVFSIVDSYLSNLTKSTSKSTLEKDLEKTILNELNFESLSKIEQAIAQSIIFSVKFRIKKSGHENKIPVRVTFNDYSDFKLHDSVKKFLKYQWMQKQYSDYVDDNLRWNFGYVKIRLDQDTTLHGEEAADFVFGKKKTQEVIIHDMR